MFWENYQPYTKKCSSLGAYLGLWWDSGKWTDFNVTAIIENWVYKSRNLEAIQPI